ncbi:cysteine--tRNA ligase [Stutzerimonas nitrititolerans]|uniref:cysteine--tRNA ligase n=1 Tax=Stutzerimonas nitrititolerans TaxID=2482751 RepID=UPI000ED8DA85|nr:cysteine--tRNA ligase [Stutzerimonas nitrititolerans]HCL78113.1 cysteine--tRNA ligase [Pseudomonas sp.]
MATADQSRPIQLYNTLARAKEPFEPADPARVTMYVCGPTVYDFAHIGNARPAVVFDVLARLLRQRYAQLVYARNFTDVDDKINAAALAAGVPIGDITRRYIDAYHADMRALGVLPPDLEPRVTEHIPDIIELVRTLIDRGNAYEAEGHVLFHVASFADYGRLSGRRTEDMLAGARVEVAPYKRDPLDFVLWKPSTPQQPGWESPWGRGRPGWHVECSAMIERHLGHTIDIHGGGQDLIFPHHENEIAQGTCAHGGEPYCRTWVHNSFVTVNGQKMSKSLGNVLLVRDLLQQAPGEAIRLALLSTHYRQPLDWNDERLAASRRILLRFYQSLAGVEGDGEAEPDAEVVAALSNDLNVSAALARLHVLAGRLDASPSTEERRELKAALRASGMLLGLLQQAPDRAIAGLMQTGDATEQVNADWVQELIAQRNLARQRREFARADELREQLLRKGVVLEDGAGGTRWRRQCEAHP